MKIREHSLALWAALKADEIPSTLKLRPELLAALEPGASVVDLGCGVGDLCFELIEKRNVIATGVDVNSNAVARAASRSRADRLPASFRCADVAEGTGFADGQFSVAVLQAFLSVLGPSQRRGALCEAHRILRPHGVLFVHDFAQAWHHPHYRRRYRDGLKEFGELGTFRATIHGCEPATFIGHHFAEREIVELLMSQQFRVRRFKYARVRTQSGNRIYGFVIVGVKREGARP